MMKFKKCAVVLAGMAMLLGSGKSTLAMVRKTDELIENIKKLMDDAREIKYLNDLRQGALEAIKFLPVGNEAKEETKEIIEIIHQENTKKIKLITNTVARMRETGSMQNLDAFRDEALETIKGLNIKQEEKKKTTASIKEIYQRNKRRIEVLAERPEAQRLGEFEIARSIAEKIVGFFYSISETKNSRELINLKRQHSVFLENKKNENRVKKFKKVTDIITQVETRLARSYRLQEMAFKNILLRHIDEEIQDAIKHIQESETPAELEMNHRSALGVFNIVLKEMEDQGQPESVFAKLQKKRGEITEEYSRQYAKIIAILEASKKR